LPADLGSVSVADLNVRLIPDPICGKLTYVNPKLDLGSGKFNLRLKAGILISYKQQAASSKLDSWYGIV